MNFSFQCFFKLEEILLKIDTHEKALRDTDARISSLERQGLVVTRILTSTHNAIFYLSAFLIIVVSVVFLKLAIRENRQIEYW